MQRNACSGLVLAASIPSLVVEEPRNAFRQTRGVEASLQDADQDRILAVADLALVDQQSFTKAAQALGLKLRSTRIIR